MTWYITKRIGYCIFIIAGVVMLTFLLFNVAAGDPAAAVLGKNPSPQEIEDLRRELGSDLPVGGDISGHEVRYLFPAVQPSLLG